MRTSKATLGVVVAYVAMAYTVMAYVAMAYTVMAYTVMAYTAMAHIVVGFRLDPGAAAAALPCAQQRLRRDLPGRHRQPKTARHARRHAGSMGRAP